MPCKNQLAQAPGRKDLSKMARNSAARAVHVAAFVFASVACSRVLPTAANRTNVAPAGMATQGSPKVRLGAASVAPADAVGHAELDVAEEKATFDQKETKLEA